MGNFVIVAKIQDIPSGSMKTLSVKGKKIAVANVEGEFFAIDDTCSHEECSLGTEGFLDEGMQHARLAHRECQKPERAYVLQLARNPRVLKHLFAKFPSLRTALVDAREGRISARAFQCRLVHALYFADLQDVFLPLMRARAGSGVKARTKHWGDLQPLPDDVILPSME
jgi:nitrite reductase/ring-hydroxylating ferredoxin subunit